MSRGILQAMPGAADRAVRIMKNIEAETGCTADTSLAIAFEIGRGEGARVMLFPGDAQVDNRLSLGARVDRKGRGRRRSPDRDRGSPRARRAPRGAEGPLAIDHAPET